MIKCPLCLSLERLIGFSSNLCTALRTRSHLKAKVLSKNFCLLLNRSHCNCETLFRRLSHWEPAIHVLSITAYCFLGVYFDLLLVLLEYKFTLRLSICSDDTPNALYMSYMLFKSGLVCCTYLLTLASVSHYFAVN